MLVSGLFLTVERYGRRTRLIAASDLGRVLRTLRGRLNFNQDFIHHFAMFSAAPRDTPFREIVRVPPGDTSLWRSGQQAITTVEWCGPATLPAPYREGDLVAGDYLHTFDAVVADLAARSGPLVATVSGGLDSTFLASSLARVATPENPVHGFCHSPLPEANCKPVAHFDPDDYPLAQLMAAEFPGRLKITAMRNTDHIHPLDAALVRSELTGWPTSSATNAVWLNDFNSRTAALGATTAFVGICGNATFSDSHRYAPVYYLGRGRVDRLLSLAAVKMGHGQSWPSALKSRVIRPLRRTPPLDTERWVMLGLAIPESLARPVASRDTYLAWCSGRLHSMAGSLSPASSPGILQIDPFASRAIIELASEIEPRHWQRGAPDRAFARHLAKGRVPEAIRTRRRRGGQGRDAWHVVSRDFDRLDRALAHVLSARVLSEVVDLDVFASVVAGLRARPEHDPPSHIYLEDVLRILALGEYLNWVGAEFNPAARIPSTT
jgi:hypothetical protein